jgi:hypothetical protein
MLRLFPSGFWEEFGREIRTVFSATAAEASIAGALPLASVFLSELQDIPLAALRQHMYEWRKKRAKFASPVEDIEPPTRWEILVALAAFLIPAGYIYINAAPSTLINQVIPPTMATLLLLGSFAGLIKRFPRWSLSYFGLVLSTIVFLFLFHWEARRIGTFLASRFVILPNDELGRLLVVTFWEGVVWLSLLIVVAMTILVLGHLPRFRPLIQDLRENWTRLSYLLYCGSMLMLVLVFDEYQYGEPYALIALFFLAAGAWGYLRSRRPARGFLALIIGATLSMWVVAMGIWLLLPRQEWTAWFRWHPPESERLFEVEQILIDWAWMLVVIALPGLLKLLPRNRTIASETSS